MNNTERIEVITRYLTDAFSPTFLQVEDESIQHHGHPGAGRAGHFALTISAGAFQGKTRIECHRMIYQALETLMETDIHALRITIVDKK